MSEKTLTGRTRYRIHTRLFRKPLIVLQVELNYRGTQHSPDPLDYGRQYNYNRFRDATFEDIQLLEEIRTAKGES